MLRLMQCGMNQYLLLISSVVLCKQLRGFTAFLSRFRQ